MIMHLFLSLLVVTLLLVSNLPFVNCCVIAFLLFTIDKGMCGSQGWPRQHKGAEPGQETLGQPAASARIKRLRKTLTDKTRVLEELPSD